jgi:phage shock protein A
MNKLKWLPLVFMVFTPLGCGDEGMATIDVLKKRVTGQIQDLVGKGDIAVQKYENKIKEVRSNLIKVKVSHKTFEQKLAAKKASRTALENSGASPQKLAILDSTIQEMERFLKQLKGAETKLEETLVKLIDNLDLVKLKVAHLEAKRDMLDAMRTIQQYSNIEEDVDGIGGNIDNTLDEMQQDIYTIEAELEIENLLVQADGLN